MVHASPWFPLWESIPTFVGLQPLWVWVADMTMFSTGQFSSAAICLDAEAYCLRKAALFGSDEGGTRRAVVEHDCAHIEFFVLVFA
jgi:hypothetical protein